MLAYIMSLFSDPHPYEYKMQQSVAPMQYRLFNNYGVHTNPCRMNDVGILGTNGASSHPERSLIDVDSNLKNLNIPLSNASCTQYVPDCPCGKSVDDCISCSKNKHQKECTLNRNWTRLTNPICATGRELGINRFQPLCLNPQDRQRWEHQAEVGINYRMVAKDNHIPKIPVPLNHNGLLPNGSKETRRKLTLMRPTC